MDFSGGAIGDGEGGALGGFELAVFDACDADVAGAAAGGVDEEEAEEARGVGGWFDGEGDDWDDGGGAEAWEGERGFDAADVVGGPGGSP